MSQAIRVGLMVPQNNTTMEPELAAWLPEGSVIDLARIPRGPGTLTRADIPAYMRAAIDLAARFRDSDVDVIAYGCTAAGFLSGPEGDAEIAAALAETTGKPVVTTARAMVAALAAQGLQRIAVVTPYRAEVNDQLTAFLGASGIAVRQLNTFDAATTDELGRITAPQVAKLTRETIAPEDQGAFIACAQLPTHAVLDQLSDEAGRPVWSSIKATAWQICQTLSCPFPDNRAPAHTAH